MTHGIRRLFRAASPERLWVLAAVLLAAVLCGPLLLTEIPPILDYPNHLARAYLLAFAPQDPALKQFYAPRWGVIPDIGLDVILPPLLHILPVHIAGRLALALVLLLPLAGIVVYNRVVFGRLALWPLAAALVAFNGAFLLGFLNFLLAVGIAFFAAAGWVRWRARAPVATVLGTAAGATLVFFCHLIGLWLLFVLIVGHEAESLPAGRWWPAPRRILAAALVFALPATLFCLSPTAEAGGPTLWMPALYKPIYLMAPVMNYGFGVDLELAGLAIAVIVLAIRWKWLVMPRGAAVALGLTLTAYFLAPSRLKGGSFFDYRFTIMLGYLVFAGIAESRQLPRRVRAVMVGGILLLLGARIGALVQVWHGQNDDLAALRATIAPVTAGSRVMIAKVEPGDAESYWRASPPRRWIDGLIVADINLPTILLTERHAFVQNLFANPAQQPLAILPPYHASAGHEPGYARLRDGARDDDDRNEYPFLPDWPQRFDYVLVMNAGGMADPEHFLPDRLQLLRRTEIAALFRVLPP